MSFSIRELALQAIAAALSAPGTPAANVYRSKLDTITAEMLPCYDFSPGEEKIADPGEYGDHGSVTRTLTVTVRSIVDASVQEGEDTESSAAAPVDDSALDPFYVFAVQALMGNGANLGGIVEQVQETGGPTIFQPDGRNCLGLESNFELKFATKRGDPTQKG